MEDCLAAPTEQSDNCTLTGTSAATTMALIAVHQNKRLFSGPFEKPPVSQLPVAMVPEPAEMVVHKRDRQQIRNADHFVKPPQWKPRILSTYLPETTNMQLRKFIPRYVTSTHWDYDPTREFSASQEVISLTQIIDLDPLGSIFSSDPLLNEDIISSEDLSSNQDHSLKREHSTEFDNTNLEEPGCRRAVYSPVCPTGLIPLLNKGPKLDSDRRDKEEATNIHSDKVSCENKEPTKSILRPAKNVNYLKSRGYTPIFLGDDPKLETPGLAAYDPQTLLFPTDFQEQLFKEHYLGKLGNIKLTVRFCFLCRSIRLHLGGICSKCNRPHSSIGTAAYAPTLRRTFASSTDLMSDMTELLSSAATGLSEFTHPSSSDEDQNGIQPENLIFDFPKTKFQNTEKEFPPLMTMSEILSTNCVPERPMDVSERHVKMDDKEEVVLCLSTSGSVVSEPDRRRENSTYARPKLPTLLTDQQTDSAQRGKIVPYQPQQNAKTPKQPSGLLDDVAEAEKLLSQLEKQTLMNGKETPTGRQKQSVFGDEDQEVETVMLGSAHTAGLNQRLLAMLQRRRNLQKMLDSDQKLNRMSSAQPRRSTTSSLSGRTQSQQPVSRTSEDMEKMRRRDYSLLTTRPNSQSRRSSSSRMDTKALDKQATSNSVVKARINSLQSPRLSDTPRSTSSTANTKMSFGGSSSMTSSTDGTKLSAMQNWQRRKTYDPHSSIQTKATKQNSRSSSQSSRVDKSQDRTSQQITKPIKHATVRSERSSRRLTNGHTRTAPVEKADCLAALASIESQFTFPATCSVVPNILLQSASKSGSGSTTPTQSIAHHSKTRNESALSPTSSTYSNKLDEKKRQVRSLSSNAKYRHSTVVPKRNDSSISSDERKKKLEHNISLLTNGHVPSINRNTSSKGPNYKRCISQMGYRDSDEFRHLTGFLENEHSSAKSVYDNDQHYPDIAVESIRYKIEKLANFIVRLRKRIEKDYAEQGTCSPGDDMFGDEAVGATVEGMSTGMHPVVASSLKNLRLLEFNAQEIFNLLYPNEIDLLEPLRACLDGTIEGEQMYNDAQSKLTDHASNSMHIKSTTKNGVIKKNERVTFSPDSFRSPETNGHIPDPSVDIF